MIKYRRMRWVGHIAGVAVKKNAYMILVGTPEEKRPLGRTRHRWQNNNKVNLKERGWSGID
jgi:hypothetical protein